MTSIWGLVWACVSTSLGGTTVVFTRMIMTETTPLSLTFARYGIALIILFALFLLRKEFIKFSRKDLMGLSIIAIFMYAGVPFCFAQALEYTTAVRGGLIFGTMPLITMCLASIFRIEKMNLRKIIAVIMAIVGTSIVLGENVTPLAPDAIKGDIYMFLGMLSVSIFNVSARKYLVSYGNLAVMSYTMLVGVLLLLLLAINFEKPFNGALDFSISGWWLLALLSIPGGALMIYAWGEALKTITPTQATITVGLNPVTAICLAAILLGEPITTNVIFGFVFNFSAILLISYKKQNPTNIKSPA